MKERLQYSEQAAVAAAKWQLGLRDSVRAATLFFAFAMIVIELSRYLSAGTAPARSVLMLDAGAILVFLFIALVLDRKTKQTAQKIRARELYVDFSKDAVVISEGNDVIFCARNDAILAVAAGETSVRFATEYDAACVPRAQVPPALLERLRTALGRAYKVYRWM